MPAESIARVESPIRPGGSNRGSTYFLVSVLGLPERYSRVQNVSVKSLI